MLRSIYVLFEEDEPAWVKDANCRGSNLDLFFPVRGQSASKAKAICAVCAVKDECLEYAIARREVGIWGGLSDRERRKIRRQRAMVS